MSKKAKPFDQTHKDYVRIHKLLDKLVDEWLKRLDLWSWNVTVDFIPDSHENAAMMVHPRWEYQRAHIKVFMPALVKEPDGILEEMLVHELCHCLVNPMSQIPKKVKREEKVVTMLAAAFMRTKYEK